MTNLYTDEQRDRIKKPMPDVWADAVHRVWNLRPDSPDVDWDNALWSIDKLTTLKPGVHEMDPILGVWLMSAMFMVEKHKGEFISEEQAGTVYDLIGALVSARWERRAGMLRSAHRSLDSWNRRRRDWYRHREEED